jgi:hypothetical protein
MVVKGALNFFLLEGDDMSSKLGSVIPNLIK